MNADPQPPRQLAPLWLALFLLPLLVSTPVRGQTSPQATEPAATQDNAAAKDTDEPPPPIKKANATPQDDAEEAWTLLTTSLNDVKHLPRRIQALAALGILGGEPRSAKLIVDSMEDKDLDVRTAAILAAGQSKSRTFLPALRRRLDDKEPQVVFAAATTLWKLKDRSGESVLIAVAEGDRRASSNLVNGARQDVNRELHDPAAMARMGALEGASMLLGPFGFGITAYEYIRKNGGNSARVTAVEDLAQNHNATVRKQLLGILGDKDVTVRVAAAKALASYHDPEVRAALLDLLADPKLPVRLTAAGAYLESTTAAPAHAASARKK